MTKPKPKGLAERISEAMLHAGYDPDPAAKKRREFARLCGLDESHINVILAGHRHGISEETARRIGRASGVSWRWLMSGSGDMDAYEGDDSRSEPPREHWPARRVVAAMARKKGVDEAAIAGMLAWVPRADDAGDPASEDYWWDVLLKLEQQSHSIDERRKGAKP